MNRTRLFAAIVSAAAVLAPSQIGYAGDEDSSGEGLQEPFLQVWQVQVTPDQATLHAGKYEFKDLMLFERDGFFTAEAFGPLGFGRSEYELTALSAAATGFSTTMSNGEQGTVVWNGVLQSNRIVGTLVWTKPDGSVGTYDFSASPLE